MRTEEVDLSGNVDAFVIDGDRLIPVNFRTTPVRESAYSRLAFGRREE